jgi:ABC-type glycerol-3-phosphate transport system substrate-binding protein
MHRRFLTATALALVAALAALAAATTATAQTATLTVVGPWQGANQQSFRAVLDGFE